MVQGEDTQGNQREDLREVVARLRRERDQRIAELPAKVAREPIEPSPGLKELIDTHDEFRDRMLRKLERAFR